MSITRQDSETMAQRDNLSDNERMLIDEVFNTLYVTAGRWDIKAAGDDRAATLEAALIRFIIASKE